MDSQFDKGLATRKQVMGEDFVARAFGGATDFTAPWACSMNSRAMCAAR